MERYNATWYINVIKFPTRVSMRATEGVYTLGIDKWAFTARIIFKQIFVRESYMFSYNFRPISPFGVIIGSDSDTTSDSRVLHKHIKAWKNCRHFVDASICWTNGLASVQQHVITVINFSQVINLHTHHQGTCLLTWFNFNPSMDKYYSPLGLF